MKVLFLDCDGVINTRPGSLDEDKLLLLAEIFRQTNCRIVLSTSWRDVPSMRNRLVRALWHLDIPVIGDTPVLKKPVLAWGLEEQRPRHEEIRAWLHFQKDPVESYCILDDMDYADDGSGRFVKTNGSKGLTKGEVRLVIEILNTPL